MSKITVITGASSGIGFHTAHRLAKMDHTLLLVCRNLDKAEEARKKILNDYPQSIIDIEIADLSSQAEIRSVADRITQRYPKIDNLINNAGIWLSKREITEDQIEKVFAVNHLAPFLLTHLLYPSLSLSNDGRVITVSSDSHFQTGMKFADLGMEKGYHGLKSYAQSKLANVLFTYEMNRIKPDQNVSVYAVQPGLVKTDIGTKDTNWLHSLAWKVRRSGGVSPVEGADTSVFLASEETVKGLSGKYWDKCKPKSTSKKSYIKEDAMRLWSISEKLCFISDYFTKIETGAIQ